MATSLRLFLIRHGETVDNVAQLYAGSRDSELTNHGFHQAERLGQHFQARGLTFTHIFSSHLQRAAKTADRIREAQLASESYADNRHASPEVTQLPVLMEQDFGSIEGKSWSGGTADSRVPGKKATEFVEVETKDAMRKRADVFLDKHLVPLIDDSSMAPDLVIAIVSHGIFLSILWKRILKRLPIRSVALCDDGSVAPRPSLEHLGAWSNTGYLEVLLTRFLTQEASPFETVSPDDSPLASLPGAKTPTSREGNGKDEALRCDSKKAGFEETPLLAGMKKPSVRISKPDVIQGWNTLVMTINGKDHLKGLKRTGGGLGSSRHDTSQRSIETFFKRRRVE